MNLYANDSALFGRYKSFLNLRIKTQTDFQKIERRIKCNRLSLNYNKLTAFFLQASTKTFSMNPKTAKIATKSITQNWSFINCKLSRVHHFCLVLHKVSFE